MRKRQTWLGKLAVHLGMGAGLGASLALFLLVSNTHGIFDMLSNGPAPAAMTAVLIGFLTVVIAVGAGITGLIFMAMEDGSR